MSYELSGCSLRSTIHMDDGLRFSVPLFSWKSARVGLAVLLATSRLKQPAYGANSPALDQFGQEKT